MVVVVVCLGLCLPQVVCQAEYIDADPWSIVVEGLGTPGSFAVLEMLSVNFYQPQTMESEEMPEWLIKLICDASQIGCLPLIGEWLVELPDLRETLMESPAYLNEIEQYSLRTLMRVDQQHSTYIPIGTPMGNYYAFYDGSECTAVCWDLLHARRQPWATECRAVRAAGSILGAIMLCSDNLEMGIPMVLFIDGAGHIFILARTEDIEGLQGINWLDVESDVDSRAIIGVGRMAIGVVSETGMSLLHPDILIP